MSKVSRAINSLFRRRNVLLSLTRDAAWTAFFDECQLSADFLPSLRILLHASKEPLKKNLVLLFIGIAGRYPEQEELNELTDSADFDVFLGQNTKRFANKLLTNLNSEIQVILSESLILDVSSTAYDTNKSGIPRTNFSLLENAPFIPYVWSDRGFFARVEYLGNKILFPTENWILPNKFFRWLSQTTRALVQGTKSISSSKLWLKKMLYLIWPLFNGLVKMLYQLGAPKAKTSEILCGSKLLIMEIPRSSISSQLKSLHLVDPHTKVTLAVHDFLPLEQPNFFSAQERTLFLEFLSLFEIASSLLVFSSAVERKARAFLNLSEKALASVFRVSLTSQLSFGRVDLVVSESNSPYFVVMGGLDERKNLHSVMKAAVVAKQNGVNAEFVCVIGSARRDTRSARALKLSREMGVRIRFEFRPSDFELARMIAGATGVIYASLAEGFGLPVIEAVNLGVPAIVGSEVPALEEIKSHYCIGVNAKDFLDISREITKLYLLSRTECELKFPNKKPEADHLTIRDWALAVTEIINSK